MLPPRSGQLGPGKKNARRAVFSLSGFALRWGAGKELVGLNYFEIADGAVGTAFLRPNAKMAVQGSSCGRAPPRPGCLLKTRGGTWSQTEALGSAQTGSGRPSAAHVATGLELEPLAASSHGSRVLESETPWTRRRETCERRILRIHSHQQLLTHSASNKGFQLGSAPHLSAGAVLALTFRITHNILENELLLFLSNYTAFGLPFNLAAITQSRAPDCCGVFNC